MYVSVEGILCTASYNARANATAPQENKVLRLGHYTKSDAKSVRNPVKELQNPGFDSSQWHEYIVPCCVFYRYIDLKEVQHMLEINKI